MDLGEARAGRRHVCTDKVQYAQQCGYFILQAEGHKKMEESRTFIEEGDKGDQEGTRKEKEFPERNSDVLSGRLSDLLLQ